MHRVDFPSPRSNKCKRGRKNETITHKAWSINARGGGGNSNANLFGAEEEEEDENRDLPRAFNGAKIFAGGKTFSEQADA